MQFGRISIAFASSDSLTYPIQPGITVSPAGMFLARAVPGTTVTSAGKIPGGNSSPGYAAFAPSRIWTHDLCHLTTNDISSQVINCTILVNIVVIKIMSVFNNIMKCTLPAQSLQCRLRNIVGWHYDVSRVVRTTPRQYRQRNVGYMFAVQRPVTKVADKFHVGQSHLASQWKQKIIGEHLEANVLTLSSSVHLYHDSWVGWKINIPFSAQI